MATFSDLLIDVEDMYVEGRSPEYIAAKLDLPREEVEAAIDTYREYWK